LFIDLKLNTVKAIKKPQTTTFPGKPRLTREYKPKEKRRKKAGRERFNKDWAAK